MTTSTSPPPPPPTRILVINPNTSTQMTKGLEPVVESLGFSNVEYSYFTCPKYPFKDLSNNLTAKSPTTSKDGSTSQTAADSTADNTGEPNILSQIEGIPSINSPKDAAQSAEYCLPHLIPILDKYDAFLVSCYSQHPLVPQLKHEIKKLSGKKHVTGIFEASVVTSLSLIDDDESFGIVSTGKVWEAALQKAVDDFLGRAQSEKFIGCETTGLNASELHELPAEQVREKMMEATKRLVKKGVEGKMINAQFSKGILPGNQMKAGVDTKGIGQVQKGGIVGEDVGGVGGGGRGGVAHGQKVRAICLGCAGMVGLDEAVRTACVEVLGQEEGSRVHIVDGVKAGVALLYALASGGF